jgi:hypothetical protein
MTLTAGALTLVSVAATTANLSSAVATSGTAPYTYQWYRSTTSGFTPGSGNLISGATALTLADTGLIPNTTYYYKVVATDSVSATATATQLAVVTAANPLQPNQFAQTTVAGQLDQKLSLGTFSAMVDSTQATAMVPGQAVKIVDSQYGVPKVVACAASSDNCAGFISGTSMKDQTFAAGQAVEIGGPGTCIYLYATSAVSRGAQVQLDVASPASVTALVGSSGAAVIGWAYDKATAYGQLIRVRVMETCMFTKA